MVDLSSLFLSCVLTTVFLSPERNKVVPKSSVSFIVCLTSFGKENLRCMGRLQLTMIQFAGNGDILICQSLYFSYIGFFYFVFLKHLILPCLSIAMAGLSIPLCA